MKTENSYAAFENNTLIARGPLPMVVLQIKKRMGNAANSSAQIFSDETGRLFDFNFHGSESDVLRRLEIFLPKERVVENPGPGRPKIGVISREVSLLPRHWEWLATQKGGASATLRQLVEVAKGKSSDKDKYKQAQERTYHFMSRVAGDFENYEEALRALYKKNKKAFLANIKVWPKDIKKYVTEISQSAFGSAYS